jgi:hypothetical protein
MATSAATVKGALACGGFALGLVLLALGSGEKCRD